jgi:hypothetical protein
MIQVIIDDSIDNVKIIPENLRQAVAHRCYEWCCPRSPACGQRVPGSCAEVGTLHALDGLFNSPSSLRGLLGGQQQEIS